MIRRLPTVLLLPLLVACGSEGPRPSTPDAPLRLQPAATQASDTLGLPSHLAIVGERLIVADRQAPFLHVLTVPDLRYVGSTGGEGGGPGEFRTSPRVSSVAGDPAGFWAWDAQQTRMTRYRVTEPVDAMRPLETVALSLPTVFFDADWLTDSTLVGVGLMPEGRMSVLDRAGAPLGSIGTRAGRPDEQATPHTVLQHAYAGPLVLSPDRRRIAVATRQADLLQIFEADGRLVRELRGAGGFDPVYETAVRAGGVGMATGGDLRFGYLSLAATAEHVFALFSGDLRGDMPGRANAGLLIHVFDWDGERVATLELPERSRDITVSADGRELYATHDEPSPHITRYSLPSL